MTTIERVKVYIAPDGTIYDAPPVEIELFRTPDGDRYRDFEAAFRNVVGAWCDMNAPGLNATCANRQDLIALAHFVLSLQPDEAQ